MKKFNKQLLLFKDIFGKKVEADFRGGEVSSDAGLLFLREVERQVCLFHRVAEVLRDRRHPGYVTHQIIELLKQRVFQIACGYEDGDDSDELRNDPVLKMACERLPDGERPRLVQRRRMGLEDGNVCLGRFENEKR